MRGRKALMLGFATAMLLGCRIEVLPSRRVDSLIEDYSSLQPDTFDSFGATHVRGLGRFSIQGADFAGPIEHQMKNLMGQGRSAQRELERLVLTTADSGTLNAVVARIKTMFREPPFEACARRGDGTSDRALIWRVGSRGGVVIRTPATHANLEPSGPWVGRLILVRHAVRRVDVGQRVFDLPCSTVAPDDTVVNR